MTTQSNGINTVKGAAVLEHGWSCERFTTVDPDDCENASVLFVYLTACGAGGPTVEISRHRMGKALLLRDYPAGQELSKTGTVGGYNEYIVNSIRALRQETNRWTTQRLYNGSSNTCAAAFRAARRRGTTSATCDNSSVSASSRGTKSRAPTWTPS